MSSQGLRKEDHESGGHPKNCVRAGSGIEPTGTLLLLQVTDYTLPRLPATPKFPSTIARYCTPTQRSAIVELSSSSMRVKPVLSFRDSERNAIIHALKTTRGGIAGKGGAAELLSLKRTTLLNKMSKLNIARNEYCN